MGKRQELEALGEKILNASKTELYLSMHFMGAALNSLGYQIDVSTTTIGTDAVYIRYNPNFLLHVYMDYPKNMNRCYMHVLLHCLFRHMFSARFFPDAELWNLSTDIAVESIIDSMDYPAISGVVKDYRQGWYDRIQAEIGVLTAEKIYRYFSERERDYAAEAGLQAEFVWDDHSFWERMEDEETDGKNGKDPELPPENNQNPPGEQKEPPKDPRQGPSRNNPRQLRELDRKIDEEWKKKAEKVRAELSVIGKDRSEEAGDLERILSFENIKRTDYREFLKKFSVIREESAVDPDSFDYGFYNYGMEMYGNMPLLEENEFREARKVDELVIAIDTSASCQQTLVQKFLNETAAILRSQEIFFHRVNVHIIECDEKVQNDILITDVNMIEKYAEGFSVKGGYGTDFRPVFTYVEELQKQGKLSHLKGLMYFTDGYGIYPAHPTKYDTAFVFRRDEDLSDADVPDWAVKLYI